MGGGGLTVFREKGGKEGESVVTNRAYDCFPTKGARNQVFPLSASPSTVSFTVF